MHCMSRVERIETPPRHSCECPYSNSIDLMHNDVTRRDTRGGNLVLVESSHGGKTIQHSHCLR